MARNRSNRRRTSKSFGGSNKRRNGERDRGVTLSARARKLRTRREGSGASVRAGSRTLSLEASPMKAVRPGTRGSKSQRRRKRRGTGTDLERAAARLIDQAARLIKSGIHLGAETVAESRRFVKRRAGNLVDDATHRLNTVVRRSGRLAHQGLEQI